MKHITNQQIQSLAISPATCLDWIKESFSIKGQAQLPAKMSVHPRGNDFITTMPCLLPAEYGVFGVKVVSRIKGQNPALKSELMLYDTTSGDLLALMDANWITTMRTGAVAALAIQTLGVKNCTEYSFIGLGNTAYATLQCLLNTIKTRTIHIRLMRYKDQAERCRDFFSHYKNVRLEIVDNIEDLVRDSQVIVSCITDADGLLVENTSLFSAGCLVVPVHTRGFQNCDLCFDKVFADDTDHVKGFKYFSQFQSFGELSDVLSGKIEGRKSDQERILSYNIGLGLHDVIFAKKIMQLINNGVTDKY